MFFREHFFSDVFPHLQNDNENAHNLFFTSPPELNLLFKHCAINSWAEPNSVGLYM